MTRPLLPALISVLLLTATTIPLAGEPPKNKKEFFYAWQNRTVLVAQPLYSIVNNNSGVLPSLFTRDNRVTGVTVGTPDGTLYMFEARPGSQDAVIEQDPDRLLAKVRDKYKQAEALTLVRYAPGVTMFVDSVQIEGDRVRMELHQDRHGTLATTVIVRWPSRLSDAFTEAPQVWEVLRRYVTRI